MIGIILPKGDDKLLGALLFQKDKGFRVYLPEDDPFVAAYEGQLPLVRGGLDQVQEPYVWFLEPGALPDKEFVKRAHRTISRHPDFDVYHANLADPAEPGAPKPGKLPRIARKERLFVKLVADGVPAPLSAFVFSTPKLREKLVFRADGSVDPLPTILACGSGRGVRNIWRQTLGWTAPAQAEGPAAEEARVKERLDFIRWTESFYGDDYPLGVGDRLEMLAAELAKLFPSYSEAALKEMMQGFQVSSGAVRKMRAASALKSALKARQQELK